MRAKMPTPPHGRSKDSVLSWPQSIHCEIPWQFIPWRCEALLPTKFGIPVSEPSCQRSSSTFRSACPCFPDSPNSHNSKAITYKHWTYSRPQKAQQSMFCEQKYQGSRGDWIETPIPTEKPVEIPTKSAHQVVYSKNPETFHKYTPNPASFR